MNPNEKGWRTSEFWTLLGTLATCVTALFFTNYHDPASINTAIVNAISAVGAVVSYVMYVRGRTQVKVAAIAARLPAPSSDLPANKPRPVSDFYPQR